jgi:hypothetical protein
MNFGLYFNLGIEHITDPFGYDHILFIIAMCCNYRVFKWKNIVFLVTAFTIGHSIALAMAVLNIVAVNSALIEFLIPITILVSCIRNMSFPLSDIQPHSVVAVEKNYWAYILILIFGLIHGLGFSNFLKETLVANESIFMPLLAFNLGLEVGQIIIVFLCLLINLLFLDLLRKHPRDWTMVISGGVASIALLLSFEKGYLLFSTVS